VPKSGQRPPENPRQIAEADRDYYLERRYPAFGNLVPRDIASRAAKTACDEGLGVGATGLAVYLDFADAIKRLKGRKAVEAALRQPVRDV
jgi:succinate dehydrogenase / fumarate reductase flavoprotein subunit